MTDRPLKVTGLAVERLCRQTGDPRSRDPKRQRAWHVGIGLLVLLLVLGCAYLGLGWIGARYAIFPPGVQPSVASTSNAHFTNVLSVTVNGKQVPDDRVYISHRRTGETRIGFERFSLYGFRLVEWVVALRRPEPPAIITS